MKHFTSSIKRPPCANCCEPEGGFMNSGKWGHHYMCCSDACGERLDKRLESGMVTAKAIKEKTRQVEYINHFDKFSNNQDDQREKLLRFRIKQLESQLNHNGIEVHKFPERGYRDALQIL